jgi:glycosyltransferase involved in cell wall biosynthesis
LEIIVVDDGSSDATAAICDKLKARYPELEVIGHGQNRGYGAALKSGIMAAKHELIFFSDSDRQFDLHELQQLIRWAEDYDTVAGYRAKRRDPLHRRINALGWNVLVRLVLGIKIRDIDCAFKLFRRAVFDQVQIRVRGCDGQYRNPCPSDTAWHAHTSGQSRPFPAALWETVRRKPPRYHQGIS